MKNVHKTNCGRAKSPPAHFNTFSLFFKEDNGAVVFIGYELLDVIRTKYRNESLDLVRILISLVYTDDVNVCLCCHGIALFVCDRILSYGVAGFKSIVTVKDNIFNFVYDSCYLCRFKLYELDVMRILGDIVYGCRKIRAVLKL